MPTRAEVFNLLSQYVPANVDFNQRLDQVRAELLPAGNWRGSKKPTLLTIFTDVDGYSIVTLPRELQTILAGKAFPPSNLPTWCYRWNFAVHNVWYQFIPTGSWLSDWSNWPRGFDEVPDRFCTFQDWTTPLQLRFRFAFSEPQGQISIRGTSNGVHVYTGTGGSPAVDGEIVTFSGVGPATSVTLFDARGLTIVKPVTKSVVSMYTLSGTTETLVAQFEPDETFPRWKRYFVPNITNPATNQFFTLCKIQYLPLKSDFDEVVPGHPGALRRGFEALKLADAHDFKREDEMWAKAKACLIEEREDDEGAPAAGVVQMVDTFRVGDLTDGYGCYGWDSWDGNW